MVLQFTRLRKLGGYQSVCNKALQGIFENLDAGFVMDVVVLGSDIHSRAKAVWRRTSHRTPNSVWVGVRLFAMLGRLFFLCGIMSFLFF
jgi:hypothetical protein